MTTNDPSVQANLIRVIAKAMKFTDDEKEKIMQFHGESSKSAFEKVRLYSFFNNVILIDTWWFILNKVYLILIE